MWKKDIIGLRTVVKLEIYEVGSCSLQGLIVHPGVVDQDYKGELQVLCSCPQGVFLSKDCLSQLASIEIEE